MFACVAIEIAGTLLRVRGTIARGPDGPSGEAIDADRLVAAADLGGREQLARAGVVAEGVDHGLGGEEARAVELVELLDAGGEVHGVADDRVLLAARRADG